MHSSKSSAPAPKPCPGSRSCRCDRGDLQAEACLEHVRTKGVAGGVLARAFEHVRTKGVAGGVLARARTRAGLWGGGTGWLARSGVLAGMCVFALALGGCGEDAGGASVEPCESREASASVRGQVTTPACTETIAGAEVELYDELLLNKLGTATSNSAGEFTLARPASGRYILLGKKGPYTARSAVFEVTETCPYQILTLQ